MTSKVTIKAMSSDVLVSISHCRAAGDTGPAEHEKIVVLDGESYERDFWDGMVISATETGDRSAGLAVPQTPALQPQNIGVDLASGTDQTVYFDSSDPAKFVVETAPSSDAPGS